MRFDIAKSGNSLTYEIRNIVGVANRLEKCGVDVTWKNIGDPVHKGEKIPDWMKETLIEIIREDSSYAYSPTKGVDATREFLAEAEDGSESDLQQTMARLTGNYKRGNERLASQHPRNRRP